MENCRILYDDDDGGVVLVCEFIDRREVLAGYGDRRVCFVAGDQLWRIRAASTRRPSSGAYANWQSFGEAGARVDCAFIA